MAKTEEPSKYAKAELIANAKAAFGVNREIMAGALHGAADELTKAEAKTLVDAFLQKPIE